MVIATNSNKRPTTAHKKRTGQHQKQTKHYLKTYWPYLPLLIVAEMANTFIVSYYGNSTAGISGDSAVQPTRLQQWTHSGAGISILVSVLAFVAIMYVFARHAKAWRKALIKGEAFALEHHMIDAGLVGLALIGIVITRSV